MLVSQAKEDLANDGCYPAQCRNAVSDYNLEEASDDLGKKLLHIYIELWKSSDAEKFYSVL